MSSENTGHSFYLLFDNNPLAMWVYDRETLRFLTVNEAAIAAYGYSRAEFLQMHITQICSQEDVPRLLDKVASRPTHLSSSGEWRHCRKDGQIFPVQIVSHTLVFESRPAVLAVAHNIADRKRAEEAGRSSEQKFRTLVENSPDIITRFDRQLRHIYVSPAVERATGLPADAFAGKTYAELGMFPDLAEYWENSIRQVFESGQESVIEFDFPAADGTRHYHARLIPELGEDGAVEFVMSIARDVTDLKRSQAELAQALEREQTARVAAEATQQRLTFLFEAGKVLASSLDYNTTLASVARLAVLQFADWCAIDLAREDGTLDRVTVVHKDPAKVVLARSLQERYPPNPDAQTGAMRVLRTGQPELVADIPDSLIETAVPDRELREILRGLGLRSYILAPLAAHDRILGVLTLVMAESGRRFSTTDLDLAMGLSQRAALAVEKARLYRQAQDLNAELEQRVQQRTAQLAATNQELEAFAYSVSHDLRAPLRSIDGFSQALLEDCYDQLDETGRRYLERCRSASQRMGQLIDDLLQLSRVTRSEMCFAPVDLTRLVQRIVGKQKQHDPERQIEWVVAEGIVATGDEHLLEILLENLLNNAWKFTGRRDQARIEFGALPQPEEPVYFVRDNGVGFDMAYANKLFSAFQRLHGVQEFPGTGIGLATVQRIAHRHGGRVWAEAAVGAGATFHFTLGERTHG